MTEVMGSRNISAGHRPKILICCFFLLCLLLCGSSVADTPAESEIPYDFFTLDNGLRVIVHEDRKAPIVAVGVWYHVGSKNEPQGKTGFAHLFEHIMFEGSEHYDQDFSIAFDHVGATSVNGTTWYDRTNYFENVPTTALELALWLESDRMGYLLGALTQEKLDQERDVVKNEKRQRDNQPYGKVNYHLLEGLFPVGHPYRHDTIGSMSDLDSASLDDVKEWFSKYYGAANTVLVLAGDVDSQQARKLVQKYFGWIPPGPPVSRMKSWVPVRDSDTREELADRVPHVRTLHNWVVPGRTERDFALLQLAAQIMGNGKNSRLYQALVYEQQLAIDVTVRAQGQEIASIFTIDVTLKHDTNRDEVDEIIRQELARLLKDGPGAEELKRARIKLQANEIRWQEVIGGFQGKAATLAQGALYDDNPGFYQTRMNWITHATTDEIRQVLNAWIRVGRHQIDIVPYGEFRVDSDPMDRRQGPPQVEQFPDVRFPDVERSKLKNGIPVVFARRMETPIVTVAMQFNAGYAADWGRKPGTASFTLAMMDESTRSRSALEIDAEAELLGAEIFTGSNLDMSRATLSALAENLESSISLFADIVRNPAFSNDELERLRGRWLAGIEQEENQPLELALRTLPPLIYGPDHPYGIPFTGSGTKESIRTLTREDLLRFHSDWIRADNATLYVVGATSMKQVIPMLEEAFGSWKPLREPIPRIDWQTVPQPASSRLILIDQPESSQSMILAGHTAPASTADNDIAIELMNDIVGGAYRSRVNQNLRIDKQWSYGAYTLLPDARGPRPWLVYAPVQTDRTADAINELKNEFERFLSDSPAREDELQWARRKNVLSLPGQFETGTAVLGALLANERFGRPDQYVSELKSKVEAVDLESVRFAATEVLHPEKLTWVVIGDRQAIMTDLEALGWAEIIIMDPDGNTVTD